MRRWVGRLRAFAILIVVAAAGGWAGRHALWQWHVRDARQALYQCRADDALAALRTLAQDRPDDPEILYLLAVADRRAGHTTEARKWLETAKQAGWSSDEILRQQRMIDFQSGKIAEAEPYLLGLIQNGCADATAVEVYDCLVKGYLADMRLSDAMFCLDYWMRWQPEAVEPHLLRAEVFEAIRDSGRQASEYEAILALDPDRVETRLKLGRLLLDQKNVDGALAHFEHCQKLTPEAPGVKLALGACYHHLGKLDEASKLLTEALELQLSVPQRAYALLEAGQIDLERRDYARAEQHLRASLRLEPHNSTTNYSLGIVLTRLGKADAAKPFLDRSEALRGLFSRYAELMREITQDPGRAQPRAAAAGVLLEIGDRKLAWSWLMSALRCDRTNILTHQTFAKYHNEGGDDEMAKRHLAWAEEFSQEPPAEVAP